MEPAESLQVIPINKPQGILYAEEVMRNPDKKAKVILILYLIILY